MNEFLNEQFGSFMNTTTMCKYFPKKKIQPQSIQNPIYALTVLDSLIQEETVQQNIFRKNKQRRDSIASTDAKFSLNKNCQRVKSINNLFTLKQQRLRNQEIDKKQLDVKSLKKSYMKMTKLNIQMENFQRTMKIQNIKVDILKKFNTRIQNHYDKFQINEDQTRQEIVENDKIIKICQKQIQPERQKAVSLSKVKQYQSMKLNEDKLVKAINKFKQQTFKGSISNSFLKRNCKTTHSKFKPSLFVTKMKGSHENKQNKNIKLIKYPQQKQSSFSVFVKSQKNQNKVNQLRKTYFAPVSESFFLINENINPKSYGKSFGF